MVSNTANLPNSTTGLVSYLARARWTSFLIDSNGVSVEWVRLLADYFEVHWKSQSFNCMESDHSVHESRDETQAAHRSIFLELNKRIPDRGHFLWENIRKQLAIFFWVIRRKCAVLGIECSVDCKTCPVSLNHEHFY